MNLGRYTAVDRSASVNKSKPKNSKPEIDFGDNNVEIYEGDSFSIYNSPNHYDQVWYLTMFKLM